MDMRPAGPGSRASEEPTSFDHSSSSPSLHAVSPLSLSLCTLLGGLTHALGFNHLLDMDHALFSTPGAILQTAPSSWKLFLVMSAPCPRSFMGFMSAKKGMEGPLNLALSKPSPFYASLPLHKGPSLSLHNATLPLSIKQTPIFPLTPSPKINLHCEAFLNSPCIP